MEGEAYRNVVKGKGLPIKGKKSLPTQPSTKPRGETKVKKAVSVAATKPTLTKTKAEMAWEKVQAEKRKKELATSRPKTHKEKVAEFNDKLSKLSDHYDIPKVGPG